MPKYYVDYGVDGKINIISTTQLGELSEVIFPDDFDFMKANKKQVYSFKIKNNKAVKISDTEALTLYPFLSEYKEEENTNYIKLKESNEYEYTFGNYYSWNKVYYHCLDVNSNNPSESYGKTFTSKFTPDMLVGRFFEVIV